MRWFGILYFCWFTFVTLFVGCTIRVEPLEKKPNKVSSSHRRHKARIQHTPSLTPTPTPKTTPKQPLQLEPTNRPTPIIQISPTVKRYVHPMDMYLG